jgi:NTE family protein
LATRVTPSQLKVRDAGKVQLETVLVMQGGGSLGAYECGVYKTLANKGIKFDIIAGTSIGAINAAIIVGSKNDEPERDLEDFWLDVAEKITLPELPDNIRCLVSSAYAAMYGNLKAFVPLWFMIPHLNGNQYNSLLSYYKWPYLYSTTPLKNTLFKYVDFSKLSPSAANSSRPRLIITSTDIQKGEAVTFDSRSMSIDADHVIACAGFPFYGIAWTEKDGRYLWDGALQSNTPLREVIDASPKSHKNVYIVNLFPRIQKELPENLLDSWHRARDIMHTDKTEHNIKMSKVISRYLTLLREMHDIISNVQLDDKMKTWFREIEKEYHKLADERGAIIQQITRIERNEDVHFLFEDADFSINTIKKLIKQGEKDTENILATN